MNKPDHAFDDRFPWEEEEALEAAPPSAGLEERLVAERTARAQHEGSGEEEEFEPGLDIFESDDLPSVDAAGTQLVSDSATHEAAAPEPAASQPHARPVAQKEYYSISEVCDLVGLKPHVLRYWETQFQVLNPSKNRSGNRVYQRKEIKLILLVKHLLYDEKYTVEGAKAKLEQMRRGAGVRDAASSVLDRQTLELVRAELDQVRSILTLSTSS